ncbi:MAG: hypothetical protein L6Q99_15180 [Planctomycetes bacterium]|nr:hypothetical protein [Planctomycetota bacterium]
MMIRISIAAISCLFLLSSATQARQCPDKKATQVDGSIVNSGDEDTCGVGLVIFGVGGGLFGEKCPDAKILTPAHQECLGDDNEGTKCVADDDMIVERQSCACGGLVVPWIAVGIPTTCECDPPIAFGTVEDFKTMPCPEVQDPTAR